MSSAEVSDFLSIGKGLLKCECDGKNVNGMEMMIHEVTCGVVLQHYIWFFFIVESGVC